MKEKLFYQAPWETDADLTREWEAWKAACKPNMVRVEARGAWKVVFYRPYPPLMKHLETT